MQADGLSIQPGIDKIHPVSVETDDGVRHIQYAAVRWGEDHRAQTRQIKCAGHEIQSPADIQRMLDTMNGQVQDIEKETRSAPGDLSGGLTGVDRVFDGIGLGGI